MSRAQTPPPENAASASYLSAGLSAFSPWGSRSPTPKPNPLGDGEDTKPSEPQQRGGDHAISRRHRLSLRKYPRDCPPLKVQWFHAVDVPKRKPLPSGQLPSTDKPAPPPKKYSAFSTGDSRAIEATFQKLADEEDAAENNKELLGVELKSPQFPMGSQGAPSPKGNISTEALQSSGKYTVPVNEDYLFDVDVEVRELKPAYWLGPVYDVRRGTWFYQEGTNQRPCDENLATQLEEGYLKLKAWNLSTPPRSVSQSRSRPTSLRPGEDPNATFKPPPTSAPAQKDSTTLAPGAIPQNENSQANGGASQEQLDGAQQKTFRLFGAHMNSVVTYQDASTAWLMTEDFLSRISSTMYERFAGGGHFAGVKLVRGYADPAKKPDTKDGKDTATSTKTEEKSGDGKDVEKDDTSNEDDTIVPQSQKQRLTLERQMSALVESSKPTDPAEQEEEVRKRDEKEMEDDYKDTGDEQGRVIEHVLLVTHGIGQRLGLRMDSVNFVHDVNTMRKTLKAVYANSPDLQALNAEIDKEPKNCRVQVIPICWRHLLDFPKQSLKHNRREQDLGDADFSDDEEYPNLDDITVDGVPAVRNLITDLALDILLYQSPAYKGHISRVVVKECNRILNLFKQRNPSFNGKVSLVGHSLGSAIMFDILCKQKDDRHESLRNRRQSKSTHDSLKLDFEVEDFYALGSPVGLFQMLKGRIIAARKTPGVVPAETPVDGTDKDPFSSKQSLSEFSASSPKCARIFNIFHPTDPISYRMEPLISSAMTPLKPQPLPYTKKGIFGAPVGQGLTGIGARVGQSVSGLWSSFSSGIASSLLNRSLGISADDAGKLSNPLSQQQQSRTANPQGTGVNLSAGVAAPPGTFSIPTDATIANLLAEDHRKRKLAQDVIAEGEDGVHPPTLIDAEMQTLYAGFQKRRKSQASLTGKSDDGREKAGGGGGDEMDWIGSGERADEQAKRLRREEAKVRALNENGRVDYSIQEGAFDISLLASIASHLSYWADEDVNHFMISQLLSRHRVFKTVDFQEQPQQEQQQQS
ncbi:DDHD-domain-containing protein [Aulographum hederae CBS 113979]|uniref:DDHD-domain-containing protein n=1 Tax=Aulographum hederae CBS 113979 TaxID=1176131 RepID=A0A6G1GU98_9PEZI|nr:DDHD-domain-containing protein [Aulographum hederae CBS 113979]